VIFSSGGSVQVLDRVFLCFKVLDAVEGEQASSTLGEEELEAFSTEEQLMLALLLLELQ
jgi:hypothetical protein